MLCFLFPSANLTENITALCKSFLVSFQYLPWSLPFKACASIVVDYLDHSKLISYSLQMHLCKIFLLHIYIVNHQHVLISLCDHHRGGITGVIEK
jgi:hypothetical protein